MLWSWRRRWQHEIETSKIIYDSIIKTPSQQHKINVSKQQNRVLFSIVLSNILVEKYVIKIYQYIYKTNTRLYCGIIVSLLLDFNGFD